MHPFEEYVFQRFAEAMRSWHAEARADIYALSFFIYDLDDDPRQPQVHLGYNTRIHWHSQIGRASSADEAKWNFAFWLQNFEVIIPEIGNVHDAPIPDTHEVALRDTWLRSLGLYFGDEDEPDDQQAFEATVNRWAQVTPVFVSLCVRVARRLHDIGVIQSTFGRPVPIIVHELEYYDTIAYQTREANPPGLAGEFEEWVMSLYR